MRTAFAVLLLAAVASVAAAPQVARPFTIQRLGGTPNVKVETLRGKIVVLAFVSTTCPHCQELTKELVAMSKEYSQRGVQFLECAMNPEAEHDLPNFIRQLQVPFPVGFSDREKVYAFVGRSAVDNRMFYVPHLVFIDRNGMVRGDYPGESDFIAHAAENTRTELDKLLKPAAPGAAAAGAPKTSTTGKQ